MARYYLDSSAYLAMLTAEPTGDALAAEIAGGHVVSSCLLLLEAHRNLLRIAREGRITVEEYQRMVERVRQDAEQFRIMDLTADLCGPLPMPHLSTPRSSDLGHLRTALRFAADEALTRFVSLDSSQNQSAAEFGLPVLR